MSKDTSFLIAETTEMEWMRRLAEQEGERRFGPVQEASEPSKEQGAGLGNEESLNNDIPPHPDLSTQRFDGDSKKENAKPDLCDPARMKYDNEHREQEVQKQNRLGLMPGFKTAPTPKGP